MNFAHPTFSSMQKVKALAARETQVPGYTPSLLLQGSEALHGGCEVETNNTSSASAFLSVAGIDSVSNSTANSQPLYRQAPARKSYAYMPEPTPHRYYSRALSSEDTAALVSGEKNHNLKVWTLRDMVIHHESRKALVPRCIHNVAPADNESEAPQHHSKGIFSRLSTKARKVFRLPRTKVTVNTDKDDEPQPPSTHQRPHISQSTSDLRSSSAPPQLPYIAPAPPLALEGVESTAGHIRAASNSTYFLASPSRSPYRAYRPPPPASRSGSGSASTPVSSSSSTTVRSPLSQVLAVPHSYNPAVTFDAFLVPHKSGKGEVLRDSVDAEKTEGGKSVSRFGKMFSLPMRRRRERKNADVVIDAVPVLEIREKVEVTELRRRFSFEE